MEATINAQLRLSWVLAGRRTTIGEAHQSWLPEYQGHNLCFVEYQGFWSVLQ